MVTDVTFYDVTDRSLFSGGGMILGGVFSLFFFKSKMHHSYDITVFVIVIVGVNGKIHSWTRTPRFDPVNINNACVLNLVYNVLFASYFSLILSLLSFCLFSYFFVFLSFERVDPLRKRQKT